MPAPQKRTQIYLVSAGQEGLRIWENLEVQSLIQTTEVTLCGQRELAFIICWGPNILISLFPMFWLRRCNVLIFVDEWCGLKYFRVWLPFPPLGSQNNSTQIIFAKHSLRQLFSARTHILCKGRSHLACRRQGRSLRGGTACCPKTLQSWVFKPISVPCQKAGTLPGDWAHKEAQAGRSGKAT